MAGLVDSHCHLDFDYFDQDRNEVLARAWDAGLERIVNPGIDIASSQRALALAEREPRVLAAVGVHPNDALTWEAGSTLEVLRGLAGHPQVTAIGEIGLDYYWELTPHDLQQQILRRQLDLAAELELPVILHTRNKDGADRRAILDMLEILADWQMSLAAAGSPLAGRPGVLHAFSDTLDSAARATQINFYIGIGGPVTFRNAVALQNLVVDLPLDRVLLETDAPFLTPHPHRGKRNEPAYVRLVAEKMAEIHSLSLDQIAETTSHNAHRLFNWRE